MSKKVQEALIPLGYSSSGIVIGVGRNVTDISVGDRVACGGTGEANHAEIVAVPRNLTVKIPDEVSFGEAAFAALGAVAMRGIRRAGIQFGETVVIFGVGLLGQLAVQLAKAAGCKVIAVDKDPKKVEVARKQGADLGLTVGERGMKEKVNRFTQGAGADAVVIYAATPSNEPVQQAMELARGKGKIVVVGEVGLGLKRSPFYEKELDFLISRSYGPGRYDPLYEDKGIDYPIEYVRWTENRNMKAFLDLVGRGKVDLKPFITTTFPIQRAKEAYETLKKKERPLAVCLKYDHLKYIGPTVKVTLGKKELKSARGG